jgi:hypothetical protein
MSRFKVGLTGEDGSDCSENVEAFADFIGLERLVPGRYSALLVLQLFASYSARYLNPYKVLHEIGALEQSATTRMKAATPFTGPHLRGLWHKHFLPDGIPSIARNVMNGLKDYGLPWLEERVRQAQASGKEEFMTTDDVRSIADEAVYRNLKRRATSSKMTGEWIVFARHEGSRYYLAIAQHDMGDERLRQMIDAVCCHEFPFLQSLLSKKSVAS